MPSGSEADEVERGFPRHQCAHWFLGMTGYLMAYSFYRRSLFRRFVSVQDYYFSPKTARNTLQP